jgi:hypothetical protein
LQGCIGPFAVDFLAVPRKPSRNNTTSNNGTSTDSPKVADHSNYCVHGCEYDVFALEINLRQGGTTHPMMTLKLLTEYVLVSVMSLSIHAMCSLIVQRRVRFEDWASSL